MQIPLQITIRDVAHSEALISHIRERARKLDAYSDHIMSCRVVVEMPHNHPHQGKQFAVRIDIGMAGGEIVVNRDQDEDVHVASSKAFDVAKRQIEDYGRKWRGDVKQHEFRHADLNPDAPVN